MGVGTSIEDGRIERIEREESLVHKGPWNHKENREKATRETLEYQGALNPTSRRREGEGKLKAATHKRTFQDFSHIGLLSDERLESTIQNAQVWSYEK